MNKTMMVAATLCAAISLPVAAQTCKDESMTPTIDPEQLIDNGDGTVTDAKTGLMWMQCSLGQTWSPDGCADEPESFSWQEGLQAAQAFNEEGGIAEHEDWRVPNIKELASLIEHQCHSPAINLDYFPDTPSAIYRSSTVMGDGSGTALGGRSIDFASGSGLTPEVKLKRHIRLVRGN